MENISLVPSLITPAKLTQLLYCWKTDCTNQFASSARPQSHLNHYSTIRAVSSSVITQILSLDYSREGVRVKKQDSSRGHDSLFLKNQSWLSVSAFSDSDTGVPDGGLPLGNPKTRFLLLVAAILSNEVELRSGHRRRKGWSHPNFSSTPAKMTTHSLVLSGSPTTSFAPDSRLPATPMDCPVCNDLKVRPSNETSGIH